MGRPVRAGAHRRARRRLVRLGDYPAAQAHVVVPTDHSGILKADETIQRVRDLCGGTYP